MIGFIARRLVALVPVLLGISIIVFAMMALLPGDPATAILGPFATPARTAELNQQLGLDGGLLERYSAWLINVLSGELGQSYSLDRPVRAILRERIGPTLLLAFCALTCGTLSGLLAGSVAAVRRGHWLDRGLTVLSLLGVSTPSFWAAMMLMLVFAVHAGWFPVSGMLAVYGTHSGGLLDATHHVILPALALAAVVAGVLGRLMRTAMLETLSSDFVRLAHAKGLTQNQVVYGHAFQVAFIRVLPAIGLQAGFVLGGSAYIETVFQWPGVGRLLVDAILQRDVVLAQGVVLLVASCYVLINLATDVLQRALDPRVQS